MSDRIELMPVKNLVGKHFLIPNYQRGYRWERQHALDLLSDIEEYMNTTDARDEFYCLQPLVVCETVDDAEKFIAALPKTADNVLSNTRDALAKHQEWEVIDGQQRLTTIRLILSYLDSLDSTASFTLRYATRKKSQIFIETIANNPSGPDAKKDIDLWHMSEVYDEIRHWFSQKQKKEIKDFKNVLLDRVQFIWYESDEDPIKVFTRLNIGKIGLTNSELIKALFLNRSNFKDGDTVQVRLQQLEIATKWDEIEAALQDDEFWMFLHEPGFDKPTRIDLLFDIICELGLLDKQIDSKLVGVNKELLGKDAYRTFRYFNAYFHSGDTFPKGESHDGERIPSVINHVWKIVDGIFASFKEWFNDLRLYHYVGFLVDQGTSIDNIYDNWKHSETKICFLENYLKPTIKQKIENCCDLDKQYEIINEEGRGARKTDCRPLLLLHNLQTVINQNKKEVDNKESFVFYKFPFHLYKAEGWDIEHIDSNSENDGHNLDTQNEFLVNRYNAVSKELQKRIAEFINSQQKNERFNDLKHAVEKELNDDSPTERLNEAEKNQVWNFALLDSSTNRSYGNAIFSAKRRIVIGKDSGKKIPVPRLTTKNNQPHIEIPEEEAAPSPFIPPCTRQVFFKYYSPVFSSPNYWLKDDAQSYKKDILETLKDFGVFMKEQD